MAEKRKTYPESFKRKVAAQAVGGKKSLKEIAEENGITSSMVYKWKHQLLNDEFDEKKKRKVEKELEETKKKLAAALMEIKRLDLILEKMRKGGK